MLYKFNDKLKHYSHLMIVVNLKAIIFIVVAVLLYQYMSRPVSASAREIDSRCDAVIFTTKSCPYCRKARQLLTASKVAWCEKDVEASSRNFKKFKELGGKGVPLAVIGDEIVYGYSAQGYKDSISRL
ncbi:glutaredoxin family protein [Marinicella sp. W31]|uniref:glutaredoxin family protein n=1 Tax=Marinicella sp. W31 TaxID=3023713 RepID=UPI00375779A8